MQFIVNNLHDTIQYGIDTAVRIQMKGDTEAHEGYEENDITEIECQTVIIQKRHKKRKHKQKKE